MCDCSSSLEYTQGLAPTFDVIVAFFAEVDSQKERKDYVFTRPGSNSGTVGFHSLPKVNHLPALCLLEMSDKNVTV